MVGLLCLLCLVLILVSVARCWLYCNLLLFFVVVISGCFVSIACALVWFGVGVVDCVFW